MPTFKYFSKKQVNTFLNTQFKEYKGYLTTAQKDNEILQREVEEYLQLNQGHLSKLLNDEHVKALAQLLGLSGFAVKGKQPEIQTKETFDPSINKNVTKNIIEINDDKFINFAGGNQLTFLLINLCFLIERALQLMKVKQDPKNLPAKHRTLYSAILHEIWITINAYQIRNQYGDILNKYKNDIELCKKELSELIRSFISTIRGVANNYDEFEFCFPCGSKGHAVYLDFYLEDTNELIFRVDNSSKLESIVFTILLDSNDNLNTMINYLVDVCLALEERTDFAMKTIDNYYDDHLLTLLNKTGYEEKPVQQGPNCVTEGFWRGAGFRLERIPKTSNLEIFAWLFLHASQFISIKHEGMDARTKLSKRINAMHAKNEFLYNRITEIKETHQDDDSDEISVYCDDESSEDDSNKNYLGEFERKYCVIRLREIHEVTKLLKIQNEGLKRLAIIAPPGGGKSTFLRMLCDKRISDFISKKDFEIKYFNLENNNLFLSDLNAYALSLALSYQRSTDIEGTLKAIAKCFAKRNKKIFFVFENVNSSKDVENIDIWIDKLASKDVSGYVFITTWIPEFYENKNRNYDLKLNDEDAVKFLIHITGKKDEKGALALVRAFDCNPYFLRLAADSMKSFNCTYKKCISFTTAKIGEKMRELFTDNAAPVDKKEDLYCALFGSAIASLLQRDTLPIKGALHLNVSKSNEFALIILCLLAYLNPTYIKVDFLRELMNAAHKELGLSDNHMEDLINQGLERLKSLQLINLTNGDVMVHKVTQTKIIFLMKSINITANKCVINNIYFLTILNKVFKDHQDYKGIMGNAKFITHINYAIFVVNHDYETLNYKEIELLLDLATTTVDHQVRVSLFESAKQILNHVEMLFNYLKNRCGPLTEQGNLLYATICIQRGWISNLLKEEIEKGEEYLKVGCEIRKENCSDKERDDKSIRAHIQYVISLLYNNKLSQAELVITSLDNIFKEKKMIQTKVNIYGQYLYIKAYYLLKIQQYDDADILLNNALSIYPPNESFFRIQILNALAVIEFYRKNFEKSKSYLQNAGNETNEFNKQGIYIYIGEYLRTQYWMARCEFELGNLYAAYEIMSHIIEIQHKIYKETSINIRHAEILRTKISKLMRINHRQIRGLLKYDEEDYHIILSAFFKLYMNEKENQAGEYRVNQSDITYYQNDVAIFLNKRIFGIRDDDLKELLIGSYRSYKKYDQYKIIYFIKILINGKDCYCAIYLYKNQNAVSLDIIISNESITGIKIKKEKHLKSQLNRLESTIREYINSSHDNNIVLNSPVITLNKILNIIDRRSHAVEESDHFALCNIKIDPVFRQHMGLVIRAGVDGEKKFVAKHTIAPITLTNIFNKKIIHERSHFITAISNQLNSDKICVLPHKVTLAVTANVTLNDILVQFIKKFDEYFTVTYLFDYVDDQNFKLKVNSFLGVLDNAISIEDENQDLAWYLSALADSVDKLGRTLLIFKNINVDIYGKIKKIFIDGYSNSANKFNILVTFNDKSVNDKICSLDLVRLNSETLKLIKNELKGDAEKLTQIVEISDSNPYILSLIQHVMLAAEYLNLSEIVENISNKRKELLEGSSIQLDMINIISIFDVIINLVYSKKLLNEFSYIIMLLSAYMYNTFPLDIFMRFNKNIDANVLLEIVNQLEKINLIKTVIINGRTYINVSPFMAELTRKYFNYLCSLPESLILANIANNLSYYVIDLKSLDEKQIFNIIANLLAKLIENPSSDSDYEMYLFYTINSIFKSIEKRGLLKLISEEENSKQAVQALLLWIVKYLTRMGFLNDAKKWLRKITGIEMYLKEIQSATLCDSIEFMLANNKFVLYGKSWENIPQYLITIGDILNQTNSYAHAVKVYSTAYVYYSTKNDNLSIEILLKLFTILRRMGGLRNLRAFDAAQTHPIQVLEKKLENKQLNLNLINSIKSSLGIMFFYLGDMRNAIKYLQMIKDAPDIKNNVIKFSSVNIYLGNSYLGIGDFENAKKFHESAQLELRHPNLSTSLNEILSAGSLGFTLALLGDKKNAIRISQRVINMLIQNEYSHSTVKIMALFTIIFSSIWESIEDNIIYDISEFNHQYEMVLTECLKTDCATILNKAASMKGDISTLTMRDKILSIFKFMQDYFSIMGNQDHPYVLIMQRLWEYFYNHIEIKNGYDSESIYVRDKNSLSLCLESVKSELSKNYIQFQSMEYPRDKVVESAKKQESTLPTANKLNLSQALNPLNNDEIDKELFRITNVKWVINTSGICYFASVDFSLINKIDTYLKRHLKNVSNTPGSTQAIVQIKHIDIEMLKNIPAMEFVKVNSIKPNLASP